MNVSLNESFSLSIPNDPDESSKNVIKTRRRNLPNDLLMIEENVAPSTDKELVMDTYFKEHLPKGLRLLSFAPYAINNDGTRIYSCMSAKYLKASTKEAGYKFISLKPYNRPRMTFLVHRLVALLYVKNRRPKVAIEINHDNGVKDDNFYKNLKWVTHGENIRHAINKLDKNVFGRKGPHPKRGYKTSEATKQKMRVAKLGTNHPKFNGWYVYDDQHFASMQALADHLNTYVVKIRRMIKKGIIKKEFINKTEPSHQTTV